MENNNKKGVYITFNKKVVSVSVLALALFMLLSVSYAYFTTKVVGNEEAKTTRLTTATETLKLDGTTITSLENAKPNDSYTINFKVINTGTADTEYDLDIINVINTFADKTDLVYTITSADGGGKKESETQVPSVSGPLIQKIPIEAGATHNYTMTLKFLNKQENQNDNQGKMFSGKIQINNIEDTELLAKILSINEIKNEVPDFTKGYPTSDSGTDLSGLYEAADNDGTSYYFRGAVTNNNVIFANKKWKIIRINGDGTIRMIYDDVGPDVSAFNSDFDAHKYVGFTYDNTVGNECTKEHPCEVTYNDSNFSNEKFGGTNSTIKDALEGWYKKNLNGFDNKIAYGLFCNDVSYGSGTDDGSTKNLNYGAYERINNGQPTLVCPNQVYINGKPRTFGGIYKTKIGLITADELIMAGFGSKYEYSTSETNCLYNDEYLWSLSPYSSSNHADVFYVTDGFIHGNSYYSNSYAVVPVINLKADVTFTIDGEGEPGTEDNPYIIS